MDYDTLYDKFIADKVLRNINCSAYYEMHHILPKCLGGDNAPDNLVSLTAREHFHAHLLLAKMTNKQSMWNAVWLMLGKRRHAERLGSPVSYGRRYEWVATHRPKGSSAPGYDHTIRQYVSIRGEFFEGTTRDFIANCGANKSVAFGMVTGSYKGKMANGWHLEGRDPTYSYVRGKTSPVYNHTVHSFRHVNGEMFDGTIAELADKLGAKSFQIGKIVKDYSGNKKKIYSYHGWHLKNVNSLLVGVQKGDRSPFADTVIYKSINNDGRSFVGTRREIAVLANVRLHTLDNMVRGLSLVTRDGWRLTTLGGGSFVYQGTRPH